MRTLIYSLLCFCVAAEVAATEPYFPKDSISDFDQQFERMSPKEFKIIWKAEVGMCRFAVVAVDSYRFAKEACLAYGSRFFGEDFDGIPIDWKA